MSVTRYTARFQLPELIERGLDYSARCEVYRDGQLVAPTSGTLTVRDAGGTVRVNAAAVTITDSVATYAVLSAVTSALQLGDGWTFEWRLTIASVVHTFRTVGALVRARLYPTITDLDVTRRLRGLDVSLPATITTRTTFQDDIDEADTEVQNRLIKMGKRPWLIVTPTALRATWLAFTLAIVFEGLASQNREYLDVAKDWRARAETALGAATVQFDYDEDGTISEPDERAPVKHGTVWSC